MIKIAAVLLSLVTPVIFTSSAMAVRPIQHSATSVGLHQSKLLTYASENMIIPELSKVMNRK